MPDPIADLHPDDHDVTALIDASTGEQWTYEAYDVAIDEYVAGLRSAGVKPGDCVGILSESCPEFAFTFFATWRLGATAVPFNARLSQRELAAQIRTVTPVVVVAAPDAQETASASSDDQDSQVDVLTFEALSKGSVSPPEDVDPAEALRSQHAASAVALLFTSGTTGDPKAVRLTAGNFRAASRAHQERFGAEPEDRWLCPLSTYHMGGLAILIRSAFFGTTAVLLDSTTGFDQTATRHALTEYDCTAMSLVPVQLQRLIDDGPLPSSLRFVLSGGAPTPPALVERAHEHGVPVCPTYGMTETTSQVATTMPDEALNHPDSVGRPLERVDVTLVDDEGRPVETGQLGEIVVNGPTVTPGYLNDDAGFGPFGFNTGDVARMDEAGRLYVQHRRDDRILTGGENVHPSKVVDALTEHPAIDEAAVVGLQDEEWGERVAALIRRKNRFEVPDEAKALDEVETPGETESPDAVEELDESEVKAFLQDRLAGYKVPKTVAFAAEIPRTPSGTVDRDAVRAEIRRLTDL